MLLSLALIIIFGLLFSYLCKKIKLPQIVGMLVAGIILGPFCLNLLDEKILLISPDLRKIALVVILIKAGLSLDLKDLKKVGLAAGLMSFLPATFEIIAYTIFGPRLLDISRVDAALMGTVLAAVSPAVVVPRMVKLMDEGYGTCQGLPQMILAGASIDDIFVIVLFSSFLSTAQGQAVSYKSFFSIPISIGTGVIFGILLGLILAKIFAYAYDKKRHIRNTNKLLIILGLSFMLMALEDLLKDYLAFSGLLAIVSLAATLRVQTVEEVYQRLSEKFGKVWLGAEILLFVLIGAAVDIGYTFEAGPFALLLILSCLSLRSLGVLFAISPADLNRKEKLFCVFSYLPKATVQAAIGAVPLAMGLEVGNLILSVAVLGILITAPLGAFLIDVTYKKFLQKNSRT